MTILSVFRKTLLQLIERTRLLVSDPLGERFTSSRIVEALNDAANNFARHTQQVIDDLNILITSEKPIYNVRSIIDNDGTARDFLHILRITFGGVNQNALLPIGTQRLDWGAYDVVSSSNPTNFRNDMSGYGEVLLSPPPNADGVALPAETGNMQVYYVAYPTPMTDDTHYPDSLIQEMYHESLSLDAASALLDEGDAEDLVLAAEYELEAYAMRTKAIAEAYRGRTQYRGVRPL